MPFIYCRYQICSLTYLTLLTFVIWKYDTGRVPEMLPMLTQAVCRKAPNYNKLVNKVILYLSYSPVSFHDVLKWAEEIFLETKVGKFTLLDELH